LGNEEREDMEEIKGGNGRFGNIRENRNLCKMNWELKGKTKGR
jgi:hypothetical protein